jgi:hypothetical protein
MEWKNLLSYVIGSVGQKLLQRNEPLAAEKRKLTKSAVTE